MSRTVVRVRDWRNRLLSWATSVRYRPYVWGETDCVSLTRGMLAEMFGEDVFLGLPRLRSVKDAVRLHRTHSFEEILTSVGGQRLFERSIPIWPTGTILISREPSGLPAFQTYVEPIVVHSDQQQGVHWGSPATMKPESAWLVEEACIGRDSR